MSEVTELKVLKSVRVLPEYSAVEVEWLNRVVRGDGSIIAEKPFNRAYSKTERTKFLSDIDGNPSAVTYADLAGLVDPEPVEQTEVAT
ncbi:MAG: hypothetical protein PHV54_00905 [Tolumonas sp.]|nr:hypothetical protein [Tolumonas sp.]